MTEIGKEGKCEEIHKARDKINEEQLGKEDKKELKQCPCCCMDFKWRSAVLVLGSE